MDCNLQERMQIFKVISTTFGDASANQVVVDEVEAKEDLQTVREQQLVSSNLDGRIFNAPKIARSSGKPREIVNDFSEQTDVPKLNENCLTWHAAQTLQCTPHLILHQ